MHILQDEVNYMLESVNAQLLDTKLTEADILSVYAGLRPLLNDEDESKQSTKRSRDYQIWWNNENMLTVSGGKLTSFMSMADNCIKAIEDKHAIESSDNIPPGSGKKRESHCRSVQLNSFIQKQSK